MEDPKKNIFVSLTPTIISEKLVSMEVISSIVLIPFWINPFQKNQLVWKNYQIYTQNCFLLPLNFRKTSQYGSSCPSISSAYLSRISEKLVSMEVQNYLYHCIGKRVIFQKNQLVWKPHPDLLWVLLPSLSFQKNQLVWKSRIFGHTYYCKPLIKFQKNQLVWKPYPPSFSPVQLLSLDFRKTSLYGSQYNPPMHR